MGVDLATYRARIGTFVSRRNVSCGDKNHSPANVTRRWRGKDICKVSDRGCYQDNLKYVRARISMSLEQWSISLEFAVGSKFRSRSSEMYRAVGKFLHVLSLVVTSLMSTIRQLLILSGDVEVNPGPLAQHGEDPLDLLCSHEHLYEIASFQCFDLRAVARRLIGTQLTKDIIGNEGLSEQNKRDEVFEKWLEMKGPKATYRELVNIFEKLQHMEAAQGVRKLTTSYAKSDSTGPGSDSTNTKIDSKEHIEPSRAPPSFTAVSDKGPDSDSTNTKTDPKEHIETATAPALFIASVKDSSFTDKNVHSALKDLVDWKSLAIQLELSGTKIEEIDVNNRGQVSHCRRDMIQFWLQSDISCSWQKLIGALMSTKQSVLADEIRVTYCPMYQDSLQIKSSSNVSLSAVSWIPVSGENASTRTLKGRYRNYKTAQVDFPPVPTFSFTNLALVKDTTETHRGDFFYNTIQGSMDDVIETKITISYKDLMESITSENRIILLEGRPGCGKTTLMRKLSKDWEEGTILTFVKYLFLIPLRQYYRTPIVSLISILESFDMKDLETEIKEHIGRGICFVFDGLDEYSESYAKSGHSWFEKLLRGEVLTSSTVVITSRPNASLELRESVHTRGEVLGFLKEQIDQYIDTSYPTDPSKATEVKAYLHDHQNIRHMCYVPLHLVMIIFIYNNQENTTSLPKTETDVYHIFTRMSLVRYFRKKEIKIQIKDLELLPTQELVLFREISKIAYITTTASKTSFLPDELMQSMGGKWSTADIANLGILVMDEKENDSGAEPIFSFVHLTNQEFLAAYHVSRLPPDDQFKAIMEHVIQSHMGVVLKFFCGLTKLKNDDHWSVIMNSALIDDRGEKKVNLRALHCVFESQNDQKCRELFTKADGKLVIKNETLTLLDYCAIGYCMAAANDLVKEIELRCQLTAEGLDIITKKLTNTMDSVIRLRIGGDLYDKDILMALKRLIYKHPQVESLDLSLCFNDRGCSDWSLLGDILKETPHLQALNLSYNKIDDEGMIAMSKAACHWTNLQELNLSDNKIGDEGRIAMSKAACHCTNLQKLNLSYNKIGDEGMIAMSKAACHWTNLQELNLWCNKIGDEGMIAMSKAACHWTNLQELNLQFNNIGDEGVKSLSTAACHWPNLQHLELSLNKIGDEGMIAMSKAACHWTNLQELNLKETNIGDDSINCLLQFINHCPLKKLSLGNNGIVPLWPNHFSADSKDTLRAAAMSLQKEDMLELPEEDSGETGVFSHPPADRWDDEDEDYSWVQQLDDFLSTEGTNAPQQPSSPPPPLANPSSD